MGSTLDIRTFGGLRVRVDGVDHERLDARSAEALLVYLAQAQRPVGREALADLLWPERSGHTARANLRSALHRLRRAFAPHLIADRTSVAMASDVRCDVVEFETHHRHRRYAEAVELYGGTFLDGFYLDASPRFEAWLHDEQERLRGLAIAARQALLEGAIADGRDAEALDHAHGVLALEPLHEPTHRTVLRLLVRSGRRASAAAHYESFRDRLRTEFDADPDGATLSLASTLFERAPHGHGDADVDPPRTVARPRRAALPTFAGALFGREAELETIARRLADPDCRWLSVTGPGGVGKTRLAVEAAARAHATTEHDVCFVPLADVADPALVIPTIVRRLDLDPRGSHDLVDLIGESLRNRRLLLVLDNLEQLAGAAPDLARLLAQVPGITVLATSRLRLHLSEEWLLPLDGLVSPGAARDLFAQHAGRADPAYDAAAHADAVDEICAHVGALPLALELAATWVNALTPSRIAQALREDDTLLRAPRPDLPPRHRAFASVFDASWELLTDHLRHVYARLAIFRGGFGMEEAALVADASLADLVALVDRSLVRRGADGRFMLHELLRRSAQARLDAGSDVVELARRHALAYASVAEGIVADLTGSDATAALSRLGQETENLRAALAWAIAAPAESATAVRLLDALALCWRLPLALDEALHWLERGLTLDLTDDARGTLLFHVGHIAWMRADFEEAERILRAAVALHDERAPGGRFRLARTRISLAMTALARGDPENADTLLDEALATLEAQDPDSWWSALAHGWRGQAAIARTDLVTARSALDTALRRFEHIGNAWGMGMFTGVAAGLHLRMGDVEGARQLARTSTTLLERVDFRHALAPTYALLARITRLAGDETEALELYRRCIDAYLDMGRVTAAAAAEAEMARPRPTEAARDARFGSA
jgi:predicted ATPase/DNA-binding SARP family transcriptional activator